MKKKNHPELFKLKINLKIITQDCLVYFNNSMSIYGYLSREVRELYLLYVYISGWPSG